MDVEVVVDKVTEGPSESVPGNVPEPPRRHPHILALGISESPYALRQVVIAPKDHQVERATLQKVLHDGILPGLYLQRIEPDLSIDSDGVGRVERFIVLQWKYLSISPLTSSLPAAPISTI